MNKKNITLIITILALVGLWAAKKIIEKKSDNGKMSITKVEGNPYWTCPMHPQIHLDHEGECPICHMKLVKVAQAAAEKKTESLQGDKRSSVQVTANQLELIGVQKTSVEKMNLTAKIPISGRILTSSSVAFQVYEKDVKYIHSGLQFKGESSSSSEDEISGNISSVDSIVDPTSRTIRVLGSINKGSKGLLAETSFSGEILIELKDRLAIPESSVLHTGTKDLVYIFGEGNKLTPKSVKLGIKTEGFYEVLSGLSLGDTISSGPNFLIDSEAKIRGAND
jgi:membrane fusion protein, copper/silver efflux system